jgi:putative cardiolipin synthase
MRPIAMTLPLLAGALVSRARTRWLPALAERSVSSALLDTGATRLGCAIAPQVASNPRLSGIHGLRDPLDAFAARILLARTAERCLDLQYYIWHRDLTGTLLLGELLAAADRGVRVRLLLDDNDTVGLDESLAALDAHPNVEVRLFNPSVIRRPRWLGYLIDPLRLNRRMHNKSFTADGQATIVGGRNVGDEYFGAGDGVLFTDLDVLAIGPVVREVSEQFDRYWASDSAYPADCLLAAAGPEETTRLHREAGDVSNGPAAAKYAAAVAGSALVRELLGGALRHEWAATRMISDDPAKALGKEAPRTLLVDKLGAILGDARTEVDLVSPYFVPTAAGVTALTALARRGVRVRVLTNALEATDVAAVHAGYAKRRRPLLEAGIALYELRRQGPEPARGHTSVRGSSSASSLHAKTFAVDRRRAFVGSFNFDPRSARLNTELGFVIESPVLAGRIHTAFDDDVKARAYEVGLSAGGKLHWIERRDGHELRHDVEPGADRWRRAMVRVLEKLPIEWLL